MLAYDPERDTQFDKIDADICPSTARLGLRRGVFLRGFVYDFITMFAPQFDQSAVEAALRGEAESYEL
jgi:LysR family cys regulon transcriptional activator